MKKYFNILCLSMFCAVLAVSCSKKGFDPDDYAPSDKAEEGFGIADRSLTRFTISMDNGDFVTINELNDELEIKNIATGSRLLADYEVRKAVAAPDGTREITARLNHFSIIPTPEIVRSTDEDVETYVGAEPMNVAEAVVTSGKYLNVNYQVKYLNPKAEHRISLLVDEEASDENTVVLWLKHNALEDIPILETFKYGRVSFKVEDLIPEGKDEINVKLSWKTYVQGTKERSFVLRRDTDHTIVAYK